MSRPNDQRSARSGPLQQLQILALTLIAAPIILAVPAWFATQDGESAPAWAVAAGPTLVLLGFLAAHLLGYPRASQEPFGSGAPSSDPAAVGASSLAAFRSAMMVRLALTDAPLLLAFTLAVVLRSPLPYFSAVGLGVLSLIWHVWPSRRVIDRFVQVWEQNGRPSYLREALAGR